MLGRLARQFSRVTSPTQCLINGQWVNAASGKTFKVINPATEEVIAEVAEGGKEDVDRAVQAAKNAFYNVWRHVPGYERMRLMHRLADLIEQNAEELARLESLDNGKGIWDSTNIDIPNAIRNFRYQAGLAPLIHGKTIPMLGKQLCYTRWEPVGVAGQIIPWNFPFLMAAWKLSPALAAGCTVVLKPAEQTPLSALYLGQLIKEAGYPDGVVNIVPGFGETAGNALVINRDVRKVAFTGSTEVGKLVMQGAGAHNLKRVTLELGGKSPNIIFDDADLDLATQQIQIGLYLNTGQCCIAGSRIFVQEKIYDEIIDRAVACSRGRVLGDPMDFNTNQGPLVDETQMNKVLGYVESGKSEGAKLLTGGNRFGNRGYFVEPTVFKDVEDNMTIAKEEIFGPVMSFLKFRDIDEVIERANNTDYGLGAGIVTPDIEKAIRVANALEAGTVYVNCYDIIDYNTPFGGYKDSGIGRELADDGIYNYLEQKAIIVNTDQHTLP